MSVSSADGRPASTSCSKVPQHLREEHPKLFKVFNQLDVGAWLSTLARRGICRVHDAPGYRYRAYNVAPGGSRTRHGAIARHAGSSSTDN